MKLSQSTGRIVSIDKEEMMVESSSKELTVLISHHNTSAVYSCYVPANTTLKDFKCMVCEKVAGWVTVERSVLMILDERHTVIISMSELKNGQLLELITDDKDRSNAIWSLLFCHIIVAIWALHIGILIHVRGLPFPFDFYMNEACDFVYFAWDFAWDFTSLVLDLCLSYIDFLYAVLQP